MAWSEKGPFRVRVIEETGAQSTFRESAGPKRGLEVTWEKKLQTPGDEREIFIAVGLILAAVPLFGFLRHMHYSDALPPTLTKFLLVCFVGAIWGSIAMIRRVSRNRMRARPDPIDHVLRVGSGGVFFRRGDKHHSLAREGLEVEVEHEHGRSQAVLVTVEAKIVVHDTHNDAEAEWLADKVREALAT